MADTTEQIAKEFERKVREALGPIDVAVYRGTFCP